MIVQELLKLLSVLGVDLVIAVTVCCLYACGLLTWNKSKKAPANASVASVDSVQESTTQGADATSRPSAADLASAGSVAGADTGTVSAGRGRTGINVGMRAVSFVCFGLCICIVLVALWIIVPVFH
jgi:hypothetical protein